MSDVGRLMVGEPNGLYWTGMFDEVAMKQASRDSPIAADYVNSGTLTFVTKPAAADGSYNSGATNVTSGGGSMTNVSGSNGNWIGTMAAAAELTAGTTYWVVMTHSNGAVRKLQYVAQHHGSN